MTIVKKTRGDVAFILSSKVNERERFAAILSTTEAFLDHVVLAIEDLVDPHNERALARFFAKMAKDNVVNNKLAKYAAGTGFAKTLNALNILSAAATNACTPEMAKAAHTIHTSRGMTALARSCTLSPVAPANRPHKRTRSEASAMDTTDVDEPLRQQ